MDKVKAWEDNELASQMMEKPNISPKKKLAPLTSEGPVQLLNIQISQLGKENELLKEKILSLESLATAAQLSDKKVTEELLTKESELAETAAEAAAAATAAREREEEEDGKHEEVRRKSAHINSHHKNNTTIQQLT